ncbi:hypothetical protein TWF751_004603 [Orbilia oligospora]|nr:hypothetical protein TWF751_004603 [Orbilia oligospora]
MRTYIWPAGSQLNFPPSPLARWLAWRNTCLGLAKIPIKPPTGKSIHKILGMDFNEVIRVSAEYWASRGLTVSFERNSRHGVYSRKY